MRRRTPEQLHEADDESSLLRRTESLLVLLVEGDWTGQAGMELSYEPGYRRLLRDGEKLLDDIRKFKRRG